MISAERLDELRAKYRGGVERIDPADVQVIQFSEVLALCDEVVRLRAQGLSQEDRAVPRALIGRAMESCQVNNDHDAWNALLWVLDPASFGGERLARVQDFLRRLGGQTT